jgi:hypothetical protein
MTAVRLPSGCRGLDMEDGTHYGARRGGVVDMRPDHARAVKKGFYGQAGIMGGGPQFCFGTKQGRWCSVCRREWNAWSVLCPRCGGATVLVE